MPGTYDFTGPNAEAERARMRRDYGIQTDAQGRRFQSMGGRPSYISPVAFGGTLPGSETGWHSAPQWNQYEGRVETPFKWGKALNVAVGAGLGAGALSAAGVFGGAAGASSSSAIGTGAVAPTAAASAGAAVPGATGAGGMTLGSFFSSPWLGPAINAGTNLYGMHAQGSAAKRSAEMQARADAEMLAYQRERDTQMERQWQAQQEFEARKFAASEEERLHSRGLADAREARQAPYREASVAALGRLRDMIGIGGGGGSSAWLSPSQVGRGTLGDLAGRR